MNFNKLDFNQLYSNRDTTPKNGDAASSFGVGITYIETHTWGNLNYTSHILVIPRCQFSGAVVTANTFTT